MDKDDAIKYNIVNVVWVEDMKKLSTGTDEKKFVEAISAIWKNCASSLRDTAVDYRKTEYSQV